MILSKEDSEQVILQLVKNKEDIQLLGKNKNRGSVGECFDFELRGAEFTITKQDQLFYSAYIYDLQVKDKNTKKWIQVYPTEDVNNLFFRPKHSGEVNKMDLQLEIIWKLLKAKGGMSNLKKILGEDFFE